MKKFNKKIVKLLFASAFVLMVFVMAGCQTEKEVKCPGCGVLDEIHGKCPECLGYKCVGNHNHNLVCPGCGQKGVVHEICNECKGYTCVGKHNHIEVTLNIETTKTELYSGEKATIKVDITVKGSDDNSYTITTNKQSIVTIENNQIIATSEILVDEYMTVTVTANADTTVSKTLSIRLKPTLHIGQVGELTSEMLEEISNPNITVTGEVTDYYQDLKNAANSTTDIYDMIVKMSEGAWYGEWNHRSEPNNKVINNYRKGTTYGIKDAEGNVGYALEELYINKNNEVAQRVVKDYQSIPTLWDTRHLWNQISGLAVTRFVFDEKTNTYKYTLDYSNDDDLWLMTYLAYSLTPMLEDTFTDIYLIIDDGHIVELLAQTYVAYYGENNSDTHEGATALSYTTLKISFSNIGTTEMENPTPYEAPINANLLEAAIAKMQNATNYTFRVLDNATSMPNYGDDYEMLSLSTAPLSSKALKVKNDTKATGSVGRVGKVTEEAILYEDTTKYQATMDGKPYKVEYRGYKQNNDGTYDKFEYSPASKTLVGTKKVEGNVLDCLPTFDFSANLFRYAGSTFTANGEMAHLFALNDSNLVKEVAVQMCDYTCASNAYAMLSNPLTITVTNDGTIVSTSFPYNIADAYFGVCTTTYYNFGTTVLDEDLFDGYVPREVKTSWSQYVTKSYSETFSTLDSHDENTDVVLRSIYGDKVSYMPSPALFSNLFGDNISGPFYHWKKIGVDANGNDINHGYMSITIGTDNYDENSQMIGYEELMAELTEKLEKEGFKLSVANTDMSGGESGRSNRYVCYFNDDIQIVVENNHTRWLWIYFYKTGDWTLRK